MCHCFHDQEHETQHGMSPRRCTDSICVLIFAGFLAGMVSILRYAHAGGNLARLTHGINYQGEICGVSGNVTEAPYLFWCRDPSEAVVGMPKKLLLQSPICVSSCPTVFTEQVYCPDAAHVATKTVQQGQSQQTITTIVQSTSLQDAYPARVVAHRYCMPDISWNEGLESDVLQGLNQNDWERMFNAFGGLTQVPYLLGGVAALAAALGFLYLLLLRCLARCIVWTSILLILSVLLATGSALMSTAFNLTGHQGDSPIFKTYTQEAAFQYSVVLGSICLGLAFVALCVVCCMRTSIQHAVQAVEASTECIFHMPSLLLLPLPAAAVKLSILATALYGLLLLVSCGTMSGSTMDLDGSVIQGVSRHFEYSNTQKVYMAYYVFGMLWVIEFCNAISHFTVSYAVCLWYYSKWDPVSGDKHAPPFAVIRGFFAAWTFHLGSLIFGSLCMTIMKALRIVLMLLARAAKAENNKVAECIADSCSCCMALLETGVAFVSKNAYIEVAISSKPFCKAAREAFEFLAGHSSDVAILTGATVVLQLLGCFSISAAGAYSTWLIVTTQDRYTNDLSPHYVTDPQFVSGVAFAICFSMALVFMDVLDQTAETLLFVYASSASSGTWFDHASDSLRGWVGDPQTAAEEATKMLGPGTAGQAAKALSAAQGQAGKLVSAGQAAASSAATSTRRLFG